MASIDSLLVFSLLREKMRREREGERGRVEKTHYVHFESHAGESLSDQPAVLLVVRHESHHGLKAAVRDTGQAASLKEKNRMQNQHNKISKEMSVERGLGLSLCVYGGRGE